jgi:hypothetical protein
MAGLGRSLKEGVGAPRGAIGWAGEKKSNTTFCAIDKMRRNM